jgi:lysophospholipase L1-like esterase
MVDMSGAFTSFVTLGDSIGVGVGFGSTRPWPNLVSDFTGVPLLENRSLQSKTTAWGLGQINALLDRNPTASHILILLGTNDARQGITSAAVANLQQMADIANQRGVIPVIGTVIVNLREPADDQRAQVITSGIAGITGARKAATRAAIGDGRGTIADEIHPNDAGQAAIAQAFVDALAL